MNCDVGSTIAILIVLILVCLFLIPFMYSVARRKSIMTTYRTIVHALEPIVPYVATINPQSVEQINQVYCMLGGSMFAKFMQVAAVKSNNPRMDIASKALSHLGKLLGEDE